MLTLMKMLGADCVQVSGQGVREGLASTFTGTGRFFERKSGAARLKRAESLIATVQVIIPEGAHEIGCAFIEPVGIGSHPCMGHGMREHGRELAGRAAAEGDCEQRS